MIDQKSTQSEKRTFRTLIAVAVLAGLALFPLSWPPTYFILVLLIFFTWASLASSWNIVGGYAGYVSIGNSFGFGLGGYVAAILLRNYGISPFLSAPVAGLVAAALGFVIGILTLRTKGPAFVIVTLSLVLAGNIIAQNWAAVGGANGLTLPILSMPSDVYMYPFYYAMLIILIATMLASFQIRRSKFGLGLMAIREDEERAASMGINTLAYKSAAFAISLFFAGAVGSIFVYYQAYVFPDGAFSTLTDIRMIAIALLGGRGTFLGPLLGAAVIVPMTEIFVTYLGSSELNGVALGLLIVLIVKFKPDGILGRRPLQIGRWTIRLPRGSGPLSARMLGKSKVVGVGRSVSEN